MIGGIGRIRKHAEYKLKTGGLETHQVGGTHIQANIRGQIGASNPQLVDIAGIAIRQSQRGRLTSPAHNERPRGLDKPCQSQPTSNDRHLLCARLHGAAKSVRLACSTDAGTAGIDGGFVQAQRHVAGTEGDVVTQTGAECTAGFKHSPSCRDRQAQIGTRYANRHAACCDLG